MHMLHNYAPSNLNRDDSGSPKDAIFGSVPRGRISSQCLKRSIRTSDIFKEAFAKDGLLGTRTQQLPELMRLKLLELQASGEPISEKAIADIVARVPEIGRKSEEQEKKKKGKGKTSNSSDVGSDGEVEGQAAQEDKTKQLIFIAEKDEALPLARTLLKIYQGNSQAWVDKKGDINKEVAKLLGDRTPRSVDIAMFGRMTTSDAFKDIHASVQVAHALSTNEVKQEYDYFTAMDDLTNQPGASMIGDIEFNSCTYYKYFNVHWEGLLGNLGNDKEVAHRTVLALLEAAAWAQPSGKRNGFAHNQLPDFILLEVSAKNLPVSYANAFLKPVRGYSDESLIENSVEQLAKYVAQLSKTYNLAPQRAYLSVNELPFLKLNVQPSLADLRDWLNKQLPE